MIDGVFPDYPRAIPTPSRNKVTVASKPLLSAVKRLAAIVEPKEVPGVGVTWNDAGLTLCLSRNQDAGEEHIDTTSVSGSGKVAVKATDLIELIEALEGETVTLDHAGSGEPVLITRPDESTTISLVSPLAWFAAARAA